MLTHNFTEFCVGCCDTSTCRPPIFRIFSGLAGQVSRKLD